MMCRELVPQEFTPELEPIFRHIETETGSVAGRGNSKYFFDNWRHLMNCGIARTWADDGCILGALFFPDVYNSEQRAAIQFWFSLPEARGTGRTIGLLDAFEAAAKKSGCVIVSIASHESINPEKTARIYEKRGYAKSETIFSKRV